MKPVETGCAEVGGELQALDASALALAAGSQLPADMICPYRYRSPLAPTDAADADHLPPPNLDNIARCFHEIAAQNDAMLVESAGGLATPLNSDADFADLASLLGLEIIVVIGNRPGCVNAAMLTLKHAENHRLTIAGKQVLARPALLLDAIKKFPLTERSTVRYSPAHAYTS